MSGIRLHHPLYKAAVGSTLTYVIELELAWPSKPGGRVRSAEPCNDCGKLHLRKALHLRLDHHGDVIIAKPAWESNRVRLLAAGMEVANEVAKPPPLYLGNGWEKREIVEFALNTDQTPNGKVEPGKTKYEARDAIQEVLQPVIDAKLEIKDRKETAKRKQKRTLFVPTTATPTKKG